MTFSTVYHLKTGISLYKNKTYSSGD